MNGPVSFELAKLLKEKGFNEPCTQLYFDGELKDITIQKVSYDDTLSSRYYIVPTIAEVVMWLYEKHGIWISVLQMLNNGETVTWYASYYEQGVGEDIEVYYNSSIEAYEEAIKYSLENLI